MLSNITLILSEWVRREASCTVEGRADRGLKGDGDCVSAKIPFPPVAEVFCPLPRSHDATSLALSLLFIWAHYPDLSVTGSATLRRPIREAAFCCTFSETFYSSQLLTFAPEREIETYIRATEGKIPCEGFALERYIQC